MSCNLANNLRLSRYFIGFFDMPTWGFTSIPKEDMLMNFSPEKIRRLRPGANPRSLVPEDSMLTTRPPKPLLLKVTSWVRLSTLPNYTVSSRWQIWCWWTLHPSVTVKKEYYLRTTALSLSSPPLLTPISQINYCFCRPFFFTFSILLRNPEATIN
jgi:hypothetical protein